MVRHAGLGPGEQTTVDGFPVTTLNRTIKDLATVLTEDDLICLLDSALRLGWQPTEYTGACARRIASALPLTDRRSESPLETLLRLLLTRAGLAPEELQWKLYDDNGLLYARLDLAWPSVMVSIEADGRRYHDELEPVYSDRSRGNAVGIDGWTVLRYTWWDVKRRPEWIIDQVRRSLNGERVVKRAV